MADPSKDEAYQHEDWPWWPISRAIRWIAGEEAPHNGFLGDEDHDTRQRKLTAADELRVALANGRVKAFGITSENIRPEPIDSLDWATRKVYLLNWWMTEPYAGYIIKRDDVQKLWPRSKTGGTGRPRRGRRKGVGSLQAKDAPLLTEMRRMIDDGEAASPYAAATAVLDRAAGSGTDDSKRKRLVDRYREKFPD